MGERGRGCVRAAYILIDLFISRFNFKRSTVIYGFRRVTPSRIAALRGRGGGGERGGSEARTGGLYICRGA